jgi:hypothetical protein
MKLKVSPAGGARIISTVKPHFKIYGARGVPKGRVEAQTRGWRRTPWRPHSRIIREEPIITEMMLPNALKAIRKFSARGAFLKPKTAVKKREAASCLEVSSEALGTVTKSAYHQVMCSMEVPTSCKVRNVTEDIEDSNHKEGCRCSPFESSDGVLLKY